VESGGGCRGGADLAGVDSLVPLGVAQLRLDVGRQGHLAQPLQGLQEDPLILEADQPVAPLAYLHHLGLEGAVPEGQPRPRLQLAAGAHQALPHLVPPVDEQQHLHRAAGGLPMAQQPGGQHPRVVEHQAVPRAQEGRQIKKMHVPGGSGLLVQHQQPGGGV